MKIFIVSKHREEVLTLATTNRERAEQELVDLGPGGFYLHTVELDETVDERTEQLMQAIGMLTTLHPTMEMDVNNPVGMAEQIVAYVQASRRKHKPAPAPTPIPTAAE